MHVDGPSVLSDPDLVFPEKESLALPLMIEGVRELESKGLESTMDSTACRMTLKSSCFDVNCWRS